MREELHCEACGSDGTPSQEIGDPAYVVSTYWGLVVDDQDGLGHIALCGPCWIEMMREHVMDFAERRRVDPTTTYSLRVLEPADGVTYAP